MVGVQFGVYTPIAVSVRGRSGFAELLGFSFTLNLQGLPVVEYLIGFTSGR